MNIYKIFSACATFLMLSSVFGAAEADVFATPDKITSAQLTPGITIWQYEYSNLYGGPQMVSLAAIDLNDPAVEIGIGVCDDKTRMPVSRMAERDRALVAINFGYFNMVAPSSPAGALKHNGEVESAVGFDSGGFIGFTGNTVAFYKTGDAAVNNCENFRAGFPLLVWNGEIYDEIGSYDHIPGRHSRTVVGLTADNILYLVTFDGRSQGNAIGVSCYDLADFMQRIGCVFALNVDGGGSTTMWTSDAGVINYPCDNRKFDHAGERRVYDILYIRDKSAAAAQSAATDDGKKASAAFSADAA